jgi:hypothetical protein
MKIFPNVITSATSGGWNWSDALDITRHADLGYFNLEWNITSGGAVTFAWSGCTSSTGTFTMSTTYIKTSGTSISGPAGDGRDFAGFGPSIFPWIRIGAYATGIGPCTAALSCSMIVG